MFINNFFETKTWLSFPGTGSMELRSLLRQNFKTQVESDSLYPQDVWVRLDTERFWRSLLWCKHSHLSLYSLSHETWSQIYSSSYTVCVLHFVILYTSLLLYHRTLAVEHFSLWGLKWWLIYMQNIHAHKIKMYNKIILNISFHFS